MNSESPDPAILNLRMSERMMTTRRAVRWTAVFGLAAAGFGVAARSLVAQRSVVYEQAPLPASYNGAFRERFGDAAGLLNAAEYTRARLFGALYGGAGTAGRLESGGLVFLTGDLVRDPPRLPPEESAVAPFYARVAPQASAMFRWADRFERQVLDVWADESLPVARKDDQVLELLAYYRSRPDLAFSAVPKRRDIADAQPYSRGFRAAYPRLNGLEWAYAWLQAGLYEALIGAPGPAQRAARVDSVAARFRQMLQDPPRTTPALLPAVSAVAPALALRYPDVAAILENDHLMRDVVADLLVSREIPRGAKGQEILRAAARFRSDTVEATLPEAWLSLGERVGIANMGGPALGFPAELPTPTLVRGASLAGVLPRPAVAEAGMTDMEGMAGMQGTSGGMQGMAGMEGMPGTTGMKTDGGMGMDSAAVQRLMQIHERMLADPVIRERVATDPVLQQLMGEMPGMSGMSQPGHAMPMDGGMPGMPMGSGEDRAAAVDFIVRLLSDPEVEARVRADPDLRRLWSDPEVQARLRALRQATPRAPASPPSHQH